MITAGIDVGTNTVRLIIADVENNSIKKVYHTGRGITRLGTGIEKTGRLPEAGMAKTLELFREFHEAISQYPVERIFAAATSAVREADNSKEFLQKARLAGIPLVTITGGEEAEYTTLGVMDGKPLQEGSAVIYDIGGGSTEFILLDAGRIIYHRSVPLGVVKLAERFGFSEPSTFLIHKECREYIRNIFHQVFEEMKPFSAGGLLVGTAGSVTSLAAIDLKMAHYNPREVSRHILTFEALDRILGRLSVLTVPERLKIPGVEKGREDLIVPGILLIETFLEFFKAPSTAVSDAGLREGLAIAAARHDFKQDV